MPRKLSRTAQKVIDMSASLTDDEIINVIKNTPDWYRAVKPPDKQEVVYPSDPAEFMEKTLGYTMWGKLKDIADSVRDYPNTIVESGFGCGKSISAASIACWFQSVFDPAVTITLAPTFSQVQGIIWAYIRQAGHKANLPGDILQTPRWTISDARFAYGLSPRKTTDQDMASLQGRHAIHQLIVLDEAAGLPRKIWETVAGLSVSENNKILAIGNPIEQSGPFYEATQSPNWHHIQISCFDHPNVIEGKEIIPGAVSRRWIEDRCTEWATPCDPFTPGAVQIPWKENYWVYPMGLFTAKVLGKPPEEEEDQLILTSWVNNAENLELPEGDSTILSCDPAPRAGDDTAIAARSGNKVLWVKRRKTHDTNAIVNWLQTILTEISPLKIYIDETGTGTGTVDACRLAGMPIVAVNSSRSAIQKKRFNNVRSEMWWHLREALRQGQIQLPKDTMLEGDLTAVRIDRNELYGRIKLEEKEETSKRIRRSPDTGDAVALLFTLPSATGEVDVEELQKALTHNTKGNSNGRWSVGIGERRISRWRR